MSLNFQVYNIGLFYRKYSPQTGTLKDLASIAVNLQKEEDYLAYLRVYITQQCLHRSAFHHGWWNELTEAMGYPTDCHINFTEVPYRL